MLIPPNKKMYYALKEKGFVDGFHDGAWNWTELGKKTITPYARMLLSKKMYYEKMEDFEDRLLRESGLDDIC
jgi:hypothetical protein